MTLVFHVFKSNFFLSLMTSIIESYSYIGRMFHYLGIWSLIWSWTFLQKKKKTNKKEYLIDRFV